MSSSNGTVDFVVGGKTYQTWYTVFGDLKSGRTPVVVVHGGPGLTHHYMLPNKALYDKFSIPVVFYDQIGNGASTHVPDAPKEFWTPELFMDELDNLLKGLEIQDNFDLLGHSWGGMLVGHYAAARVPKGLRRLIIANAPASIELHELGAKKLLGRFPKEFTELMNKHEAAGTTNDPEYQGAVMKFNMKHICTLDPWPQELMESFNAIGQNPQVYATMWGEVDWNVTGTMKGWSVTDIVQNIKATTLLLSAPLDEVQPEATLPWFLGIPKIKWVELQNSTHLGQSEEPERYIEVVHDFLKY